MGDLLLGGATSQHHLPSGAALSRAKENLK